MFVEFSHFFNFDTVSYGCVRQWILRIGLGLLHEPIQKRNDWIYITDFSIQLGKERCLLILGVPQQSLNENGYQLKHSHVRVLDIFVQSRFQSQDVYDRILMTSKKTGNPIQIISDKGSDICGGIEMFCDENSTTIPTIDISHMIGTVLKHHLEKDARWISLHDDLYILTQQINQTEMSFLRPIAISTKARWMNIAKEVEYLENIFLYENKGDFSLISEEILIDNSHEVFEILKNKCKNLKEQNRLRKELKKKFVDKESAIKWLNQKQIIDNKTIKFIDAGKYRYQEKFSILNKHKEYFKELKQVNKVAETIKCTIREKGLSLDSLQEIEMLYDNITYPIVVKIFNVINNNLQSEHSKCGIEKTPLLCSSEIIESIFGKFKMKSKQTVGGIYQSVLTIALICSNITPCKIKNILSEVKMIDVEQWFLSMAGRSNLNKRRIAFG